jgi:hypothetical protein
MKQAQIAQLVEQRIENPRVGGSNPPLGTTLLSPKTENMVPALLRNFHLCWKFATVVVSWALKRLSFQ